MLKKKKKSLLGKLHEFVYLNLIMNEIIYLKYAVNGVLQLNLNAAI